MPKSAFAESLLTLFAGRDRAAAILGDLLEMKATRGSLWFWAAYTRTLFSLTWRLPVAFIVAIVSMRVLGATVVTWLSRLYDNQPMDNILTHFGWRYAPGCVWTLAFAVPFIWVRFGWRDRLTRMACLMYLLMVPIYTMRASAMVCVEAVIPVVVVAALYTSSWRRPMIGVLAIIASVEATQYALFTLAIKLHNGSGGDNYGYIPIGSHLRIALNLYWVIFSVLVIVCSAVHRLLKSKRASVAGATYA